MNTNQTTDNHQPELSALMAAYNPEPPRAEQPERFYWQEPWQDHDSDEAVQAAFES